MQIEPGSLYISLADYKQKRAIEEKLAGHVAPPVVPFILQYCDYLIESVRRLQVKKFDGVRDMDEYRI